MIWGHFGMYVLYLITDGAYRGVRVGAKIGKGVIGRARQAASRARTRDAFRPGELTAIMHRQVADWRAGDRHGYGTDKTMIGIDPSGPSGGCAWCGHAGHQYGQPCAQSATGRPGNLDGSPHMCGCVAWVGEIQSPERLSAGLSEVSGYPRTNSGCEDAQGPVLAREGASEPEPLPPLDGALHSEEDGDLVEPEDGGESSRVVLEGDPDYNDLQTYLEGGTLEATEAAKRLDQRAVDRGQLSPKTFWDTWGEEPVRSELPHQIWCARWKNHPVAECPVWGAE